MKTNNELIAEFMGVKEQQGFYDSYGQDEPFWYTANEHFRTHSRSIPDVSFEEFLENCKYDTSWDWLMPVLEKIEQFQFDDGELDQDDEPDTAFLRTFKGGMVRINRFSLHHLETKLQAAHAAVVEFIKWYNNQSPEKPEEEEGKVK